MSRANDIYNNRIEKVLDDMDYVKLYALPKTEPWTLDRFLVIFHSLKQNCYFYLKLNETLKIYILGRN